MHKDRHMCIEKIFTIQELYTIIIQERKAKSKGKFKNSLFVLDYSQQPVLDCL